MALSFSVLSLLPAVLLHISLQSRRRPIWMAGYAVSGLAVALHIGDWLNRDSGWHRAALLLITIGFSVLTLVSLILEWRLANRAAGSRLAGAMALFLLAISFTHFGGVHVGMAWSREAALHHAGLPLALLVLLQDYRFLLMDAFLRFVMNATLAACATLLAIRIVQVPLLRSSLHQPFAAGLFIVIAGLLLTSFVQLHNRMQRVLTKVIFLRANVDEAVRELQNLSLAAADESEYVRCAADTIGRFVRASRFELSYQQPAPGQSLTAPAAVLDPIRWSVDLWVLAALPMRFARGDAIYLLLGPREGGRRYLSEDLQVLGRLGATAVQQVERFRNLQMQNLIASAELRALQAQINPHFLFNSLNTLYGTIDRGNLQARQLVLNLADVYRYLLRTERPVVELEDELRIVRAYLEIEELRLGSKLQTAIEADPDTLHIGIPPLSIQPLVENAVKHGIVPRVGPGFVRLYVRIKGRSLSVDVSNSGEFDSSSVANASGVGLSNVRRRLELCYGGDASFEIRTAGGITTVGIGLPARATVSV
ncbi:MAG TPA: histidine kinase [Bryobacteraceae bacterium]|nr:histidine kinase [Bryobacteraceae bacterium]